MKSHATFSTHVSQDTRLSFRVPVTSFIHVVVFHLLEADTGFLRYFREGVADSPVDVSGPVVAQGACSVPARAHLIFFV